MANIPVITTTSLHYQFNKQQKTLEDINLVVEEGSIYGFLGPNGAGKTTTLRLLLGLLKNQQGSIQVFGKELHEHRRECLRQMGSMIEQPSLYGHLTARENLRIYQKIYGTTNEKTAQVLQLVGLQQTGSKKAKQFSLGMKQRLSIAVALLHDPRLLILDEPTNGLDPQGIIETREMIKQLNREQGVTVLVSSHILAEIERMATHVGIIHHGRIKYQGTLSNLQNKKKEQNLLKIRTSNNQAAMQLLASYGPMAVNGSIILPYKEQEDAAMVARHLLSHQLDLYMLQPQENDLEQLFIDITANK